MIEDGSRLVQIILQWASETPTPRHFDRETGDLSEDRLTHQSLLQYVRYDGQLELDWLADVLKIEVTPREVEAIRRRDNPFAIDLLIEIGRAIANLHISADLFPARFDTAPIGFASVSRPAA